MLTVALGLGSALGYALHDFLMVKGLPRGSDYAALDALADTIAEKHADLAPRNFADLTVCRTEL